MGFLADLSLPLTHLCPPPLSMNAWVGRLANQLTVWWTYAYDYN